MSLATIILALVTLQRLGELVLARHNTRALLARGGIEIGRAALSLDRRGSCSVADRALDFRTGSGRQSSRVVAVCRAAGRSRLWILATLGERWTTRIIVLPNEKLVATGPYRYLSHPNYAVVAGEIAVLPLALHLPVVAVVFTILNAAVLTIRIRAETRALSRRERAVIKLRPTRRARPCGPPSC